MRWPLYWVAFLATSLLFAACAFAPEEAVPFTPPPEYRTIWDSAQACSGRHGDYDRLVFMLVPDAFDCPSGTCAGHTTGKTIYLAAGYTDHPMVVKHEMIHALGVSSHPYHPFVDPCHATWESYLQ